MNIEQASVPSEGKRTFLRFVLWGGALAWAASVLYPILAFLKPPKQAEVEVTSIRVGKLSDIEVDSGRIIRFGSKPVLLLRMPDGNLRALSATCTHLDCTVQYRKDMGVIWCACHNGKYDFNGRNIDGPPPRPLEALRVVIQDDDVFVSKQS